MKTSPLLAALLGLAVLAQAGQCTTFPKYGDLLSSPHQLQDVWRKLDCYLEGVGELIRFAADIPRNCVDLALRAARTQGVLQGLYVLPACVVDSIAATYQLGKNNFPACASA